MKLPIIPAVRHSYVLLWWHRALHAEAGASIGAIAYQALVKDQGPETIH